MATEPDLDRKVGLTLGSWTRTPARAISADQQRGRPSALLLQPPQVPSPVGLGFSAMRTRLGPLLVLPCGTPSFLPASPRLACLQTHKWAMSNLSTRGRSLSLSWRLSGWMGGRQQRKTGDGSTRISCQHLKKISLLPVAKTSQAALLQRPHRLATSPALLFIPHHQAASFFGQCHRLGAEAAQSLRLHQGRGRKAE